MDNFNVSGSKYLRTVRCDVGGKIDVYAVLDAFNVTCPARQHAIKKLLCSGLRGKGDTIQDLEEAEDAVQRAVQMEESRQHKQRTEFVKQEKILAERFGQESGIPLPRERVG